MSKKKILIVDDEPVASQSLALVFDSMGHNTFVASSYDEAVEIILSERPEILVVDWQLNDGHNGFDIAQVVQNSIPDAKTAIISGYDIDDVRAEQPKSLDVILLEKPIAFEQLCQSISLSIEIQV